MNKKLMALAVAGACIAPTAMAQTASPITLYGRVYVTAEQVKVDGSPSRTRIADQASLLGVRGTEDLGGGLKAFFQLETAFAPDQAPGTFANRNSGVGLQGGWGSVVFGRWDMPFKSAAIGIDPFGDLTIGGITGTLSDRGNFDVRASNVVQYWSPTMGGLAVRVAATANENKGTATERQDMGASVTYRKGPAYLFVVYEKHDFGSSDEEAMAGGGSFAFGPVKLGAQYQKIEKATVEADNIMANIVYTMGKHQLIYQYMQSELDSAGDPSCQSHNAGYQYNWTKRTFFLAQYTTVDNDAGQNCSIGANRPSIPTTGVEVEAFSLGLRHVF